jgi:hypothetical protein
MGVYARDALFQTLEAVRSNQRFGPMRDPLNKTLISAKVNQRRHYALKNPNERMGMLFCQGPRAENTWLSVK